MPLAPATLVAPEEPAPLSPASPASPAPPAPALCEAPPRPPPTAARPACPDDEPLKSLGAAWPHDMETKPANQRVVSNQRRAFSTQERHAAPFETSNGNSTTTSHNYRIRAGSAGFAIVRGTFQPRARLPADLRSRSIFCATQQFRQRGERTLKTSGHVHFLEAKAPIGLLELQVRVVYDARVTGLRARGRIALKNKFGWALAILAFAAIGAAGCGSDDESATAKSTCETYCQKEKDCDANTTVDDCIMYACADIEKEKAPCQSALKAFFECMNKSADICSTASCETQEVAYHDACSQ